jgi:putative peptidoglycan lipid II flippase
MAEGEPAPPRHARGALAVGAGILASRLAGLARTAVTGAAFGLGPFADVLQLAMRAPNLLQNLLGEQALSASFIPVYSRLLAAGRTEAARRFAAAALGLLALVAGGLALAGVVAARPLVAVFAPGFLDDAARVAAGELAVDRFELAVRAVRWIFPMTALLVLSAWALGVLNSHRRFLLPYLAPVFWNAAIIGALAWTTLGGRGGEERLLIAACVGALVGGALQLLVQLPAVARELGGLRVSVSTATEGVAEALRAFGPAVAGRGVVQLSSYLDQVLASLLAVGALSALGYAQALYLLPLALFAQSVAAAALPDLASVSGEAGAAELAGRTRGALAQTGFLNLPTTVAYLTLGPVIVSALYRLLPGRFGDAEGWLVGLVLGGYALGLPASSGSRVLQSTFFALGDTRTPARVASWRVVVGAAVGLPAMLLLDRVALGELPGLSALDTDLRLGALGLALAASAAAWLEWLGLSRALGRRLRDFRWHGGEIGRVLLASLAAAATALGVRAAIAGPIDSPVAVGLLAGGAFVLTFGAAALALGLPQIRRVRQILDRPAR